MHYENVTGGGLCLMGVETRASNDRPEIIGAFWNDFRARSIASKVPARISDDVFAVYCEYDGDHTEPYTFFLGCQVDEHAPAPPGMVRRKVPSGSFARVPAKGEQPSALIGAWQRILTSGLKRAYQVDYEVHDGGDPSRVEVYVGVRTATAQARETRAAGPT